MMGNDLTGFLGAVGGGIGGGLGLFGGPTARQVHLEGFGTANNTVDRENMTVNGVPMERLTAAAITHAPGAIIRVGRPGDLLTDHALRRAKTTRKFYAACLDNLEAATKPPDRIHTRIDDTYVAWIAAPIWAFVWCLTLGKFGRPLWRTA